MAPHTVTVESDRYSESPIQNTMILVVTITGCGPYSIYMCVYAFGVYDVSLCFFQLGLNPTSGLGYIATSAEQDLKAIGSETQTKMARYGKIWQDMQGKPTNGPRQPSPRMKTRKTKQTSKMSCVNAHIVEETINLAARTTVKDEYFW